MTPSICVVIVNYRTPELTARAVESVNRSAENHDGAVRIVVVDNSADDRTTELATLCPGAQVITSPGNRGFAAGVNFGISSGTEDLIALVNSDATVEPGFLNELAAPFADPHVGATTALLLMEGRYRQVNSGSLRGLDGSLWEPSEDGEGVVLVNSTGNIIDRSGNGMDRDWLRPLDSWHAPIDVQGFGGGASMLRRTALDNVGPMREDFFLYYEDTELSLRLRNAGWSIHYAERAIAWHRHGASSHDGSALHVYCNVRNRLVVAKELPLRVRLSAWIRTLVRCAHPQAGAVRRAAWDAARGRMGKPL